MEKGALAHSQKDSRLIRTVGEMPPDQIKVGVERPAVCV